MNIVKKRTDLAVESAQSVDKSEPLPDGIEISERDSEGFHITDISVSSREASRLIEKPEGRYITLESVSRLDLRPENFDECVYSLSEEIRKISGKAEKVLIAGLGNENITPDSLGPSVCKHILATGHIRENAPGFDTEGLGDVSAIAPGVMGQTGIEASEIIRSVCESVRPSLVITVDALACSEPSRLGKTVQLTDSGISPGSGVMNSRKELSQNTLGVPCIAIGIPTVADSGESPKGEKLMVTPRSIDRLISCSAQLISAAINLSFHRGLTLDEIISLTS